jgi:protoheme ferro-lyase
MSVPTTTQSTSTPLSSVQEATGEIKKEVEEDRGDITRKQILSWINENTYVSLVLENLNKEAYQADFTIGNPKIPFKILFSNEWKPLVPLVTKFNSSECSVLSKRTHFCFCR